MSFSELDKKFMQTALELAWQGRFSTSPNPRVGCVITRGEQIVGEGFHVQAGQAHAEIHALQQAGQLAQDATAYVTLEPCSHTGRTGPCAQALIDAHIKRVVVGMSDPNPLVKGNGLNILRQAGIQVDCGLYTQQARELNPGFLSRVERHRPYIRLKIAASLDSKTALSNGESQWITGEAARNDVQTLRAESCAVLTGINTILADNPQLNVRRFSALRQPLRIILDSKLRITPAYQVIQDVNSPTLIITTVSDKVKKTVFDPYPHVSILTVPANQHGQIDLQKLWPVLAQRDIGLILVEAGSILNSALLAANAVDEIIYYQAPKILGAAARNAIELAENPQALSDSEWQTVAVEVLGQDCRWSLRHQQSTVWLTGMLE
ncbi:MAG: bifunctional diaminohydroxyphosphoribosylaminopyrimidine deaminase/5-amino-6-(5-phosphoribosylamino)uracil reductase RibD [Snodgrassella sp.]|uniref:bifunctional diaminohydroxyphosphoribosylaminopyrimidine deaminase/5-amino-6-(5-phosphoribosylamino)uracil reductase RibD n=1 Tax=Snodgrassella sp. TaxID=2815304 RepID=UPI002586C74D|nr:bifunctional diaminohydroxyphosphoribosylaminopyrimidine deaminase/5-amino-6-(5-phosphoribosylamino)uracil reductase RibD [Snodgrassella sp.]MCO6512971.1 bifunctional diaminohydroxyphosphoribosylaminopyrimidine deaminase/5-amino-6-(5-phosphoribosylamino)uracil reductase RibD [Snodgrassella sp.]